LIFENRHLRTPSKLKITFSDPFSKGAEPFSKTAFTAEAQRSQREICLLLQSGDGDWTRNSILLEIKSLLFGGLSPPDKRPFLCVPCVSAVRKC